MQETESRLIGLGLADYDWHLNYIWYTLFVTFPAWIFKAILHYNNVISIITNYLYITV